MRSIVARSMEAPEYATTPSLTCAFYSYWSGVPLDGAELYERPGLSIISFPTNDSLSVILVQWPRGEFDVVRAYVEGSVCTALQHAPYLAGRVRAGRREARFYGTADLPNFIRKPYGPGWALVGDAGLHRDPITGQASSTRSAMRSSWRTRSRPTHLPSTSSTATPPSCPSMS
jgi:hypothetical protein